jgi:hypothetical protein
VIGTLHPLGGPDDSELIFEDENEGLVVADLTTIFYDPDGPPPNDPNGPVLIYSVVRLGTVINPTAAQISNDPLVESISFVGDDLQIELKPDQFGDVRIEIAATDRPANQGDLPFTVSDSFTLTVDSAEDDPEAKDDLLYKVPIGSVLQIVNRAFGLLGNDFDADEDQTATLTVDINSVSNPSEGTVEVNLDGTFTYTNTSGSLNQIDSFTYRVKDEDGRFSDEATVEIQVSQSRYQNPLTDLSEDVNADGIVTVIDALRIINFLGRELSSGAGSSVPVSEIGEPPPDYYDTNGDGRVSFVDAIQVINMLSQFTSAESESVNSPAAMGVTTSFVAGSTTGLPVRNIEPVAAANVAVDPRDRLLAAGFEVTSPARDHAVDAFPSNDPSLASAPDSVDKALSLVLDELTLTMEVE